LLVNPVFEYPLKTEILKIVDPVKDIEAIKKAAECVDSGGLVVFPTETVYGIACRADKKSFARLDKIKTREADKRYTLHIGDKDRLSDFVPSLTLPERKLVKNSWPGPLTIVFPLDDGDINQLKTKFSDETVELLYTDNTIGIRCPDRPTAKVLLNLCKFPVVAPSANISGGRPAINAQQAAEQLDGLVDMILDAGPCKYKKSSTVVKISSAGFSILREGTYSEQQIRKMLTVNILFVCTGNTCRSPMAEGFAKKALAEKLGCGIDPAPTPHSCHNSGLTCKPIPILKNDKQMPAERIQSRCGVDQLVQIGYKVASAGVSAVNGVGASAEAIRFCETRNADISGHKSRRITAEMIKEADYIFAMSAGHKNDIIQLCPDAEKRCMLLSDSGDISDPFGGEFQLYKICGGAIEKAVNKRLSELLK
jgi:tRNA threonylcarbamoyl adenosine modification protein (Sua5/YciO/YrdC/YwlC family)